MSEIPPAKFFVIRSLLGETSIEGPFATFEDAWQKATAAGWGGLVVQGWKAPSNFSRMVADVAAGPR